MNIIESKYLVINLRYGIEFIRKYPLVEFSLANIFTIPIYKNFLHECDCVTSHSSLQIP